MKSDEQDKLFKQSDLDDLQSTFTALQTKMEQSLGLEKGKMPYNYSKTEVLKGFCKYTSAWNSDWGQKLANSESENDVATFVAKFGQERLFKFLWYMNTLFPGSKAGVKENIQRVAQKIQEIMIEENIPASEAWKQLTDIFRLTVVCNSTAEVKQLVKDTILK